MVNLLASLPTQSGGWELLPESGPEMMLMPYLIS